MVEITCQPPERMKDIASGKSYIFLYMKLLNVDENIRYITLEKKAAASVLCLMEYAVWAARI